ncbi:MAG TPA: aminotransferase class V-fold PLP-dependent enzyme [Thermoanaerobaculaceae bacterium]|nr:aminotransferase class V-fold PLP-dependent enzyme [Thermoanaerobaculaceae bacterium]
MNTSMRDRFLLRPGVVYLNHGSFGACPRPVFERYQAWQRELEAEPVEFLGRRFTALMRAARESLAAFAGADPDDLVFVPNATTGLNALARSLRLDPGDEVLATDHEYGALDRTWTFVCEKLGARYVRRPLPLPIASTEEILDAVWSGVGNRTRVLFLSHVTSTTAIVFPVTELVRRARERGILTVIDGAHAPGQIPLDLAALGTDFYAGNCHKWMNAPKGSAFLYARAEVQPLLEPLVVSWGWHSDRPGPSRFVDEHEWQGTRDVAAYLAVPAAIEFMAEHDWPEVQRACHDLATAARDRINALTGLPPLTPAAGGWFGQMATVALPPCDHEALQRRLFDEFAIEVPTFSWNGGSYLRVSIQAYNDASDVDALVAALSRLLPTMA